MIKRCRFVYVGLSVTILLFSTININAQQNVVMVNKWGEFGDKPGEFKFPTMIAIDKASSVYIVDQHNQRIQKFDSIGNFITMWGEMGDKPGQFNYPYGIAVDSKGNVYVSDMNNNRIQKFSSTGVFIAATGKYGTEDGQLKYPYGIAVDNKDNLYVIDALNYRIQKFTSNLSFISKWGSAEDIEIKLYMPHEIAIANDGNVVLSDRQNHRIAIFNNDGKLLRRFGEYGEGKEAIGGQFSEPHGIAISVNGDIFISDRYNFRIQKLSADGKPQTQWQTSGVFDDSKHFPLGVAVADDRSVYVVDHYAHCIQRYKLQ
jgi:DNA-binding beta-propeller fold protein YncE